MAEEESREVTQILRRIEAGDSRASADLLPKIYEELRKLAAARLTNEKPGQTLQATALVHEAYLRLTGNQTSESWDGRGHFFAAAAEAMRRILVERARRKKRVRHGGEFRRVDLNDGAVISDAPKDDIIALHEALEKLEHEAPARAELIKLRYFAGLTVQQAAQAMDISVSTAERYWRFGKTWLLAEISEESGSDEKS